VSNNLGKELVSLFPNPSNSGNFTVRTSGFNAENATVIITDAVGKTVHTQTIEVGLTPVNNTVNANTAATKHKYIVYAWCKIGKLISIYI
jgi:hypothetical protein